MLNLSKNKFEDISNTTKGAGITLIGNLGGKAILFIYTLFLARVLGAAELGLYFLGITVMRLLSIISVVGLDVGVVRYVAIYYGRKDRSSMKGAVLISAAFTMALSLLFALLMLILGDFVANGLFLKPNLAIVFKFFSLSIPFDSLMRIFLASTRSLKLMQYTAYTENLVWVGTRFFLAFLFIYIFELGLKGALLAYFISSILSAGLAFFFANRLIPLFRTEIKMQLKIKELILFSIPMVFTALLYELITHMDLLMLGHFVSAQEVGIYSVAVRLIILAQVFFMAFQPIFQPYIAELHDKNELARLSRLLQVLTYWSLTLSFPFFLSLLFAPSFFLQFFGNNFASGSSCVIILVISIIFSSISTLPASIIFMSGRSNLSFKNNLVVLITNTLLNYLLIPKFGINGAALATGTSFVILALIRIIEVYLIFKIQPLNLNIWKPLIAGTCSFVFVFFIQRFLSEQTVHFTLILLLLLFLLYFLFIYFFKLDEEQIYIGNMIKKKIISFVR